MIAALLLIGGILASLTLAYGWGATTLAALAVLVIAGSLLIWIEDQMSTIKRRIEEAAEILQIPAPELTQMLMGEYYGTDDNPTAAKLPTSRCKHCGSRIEIDPDVERWATWDVFPYSCSASVKTGHEPVIA